MPSLVRVFSGLVLGSLVVLACAAGCGSDCNGTVVNGECQPRCKDEACPSGQHCFDNVCRKPCSVASDCNPDQQCRHVLTEYDVDTRLCIGGATTTTQGGGGPCSGNNDCDATNGYRCIQNKCQLTCEVHEQCGSTGACTKVVTDVEGNSVRVCAPDAFPRDKGQYGSLCPFGNVSHDECASDFVCVGAGPGDIDAYCTKTGCANDGDCPSGYFCSQERTGRETCNDVCGLGASTSSNCIPDDQIGPGRTYECGPIALNVNICLIRGFCNSCETNTDCLGRANQVCAKDRSGNKICTVLCDREFNSCPWGNASICGLWDETLGKETCAHRFGQCTGDGSGCQPCVNERDCPTGFCAQEQFTGERFCVDLSATCSCAEATSTTCSGGGCPLTPAGEQMACFGGSQYVDSAYEDRCVGSSQSDGCWPAK